METSSAIIQMPPSKAEEEKIQDGLLGTAAQQEAAFEKAYARFARPMAAYIREVVAPTLDSDEIATAVSEAFCGLAKYIENGRFSSKGALSTILFSIARLKAISILRSKTCKKRTDPDRVKAEPEEGSEEQIEEEEEEKFAICVSQQLVKSPEIQALWRTAVDIGKAKEIMRQFRLLAGGLPRMQRQVAEAILAHFGEVENDEFGPVSNQEICNFIEKTTGERPSVASIRSARKEISQKLKTLIRA